MKLSSLSKLKLWLSSDSAFLSHPNDEVLFHDFLHDYVMNNSDSASESDIRERIQENAKRDPEFVLTLISDALKAFYTVQQFVKRQA